MSEADESIDAALNSFRKKYTRLSKNLQNLKSGLSWHTSNEVCFSFESMTVREFHGPKSGNSKPVLIVYSHVNLPYVIDLTEKNSLVSRLIEAGLKVYLVDWGEINREARTRELSVYLHDYLDKSIDFIVKRTGVDQVDLIGICQGGTFSLCYASLRPEKVRKLVTMVTPVDFHAGDGVLSKWARKIDLTPLEETPINIHGSVITLFFQSLRPFEDMMRSIRLIQKTEKPKNLDLTALIDQWAFECPDQPGRAFAQFMSLFYQKNLLARGGLELNGHHIHLENIRSPVLNLYANLDHLVPQESSRALKFLIPDKYYREMAYDGGHVGLMVGAKAHKTILPSMAAWLSADYSQAKTV